MSGFVTQVRYICENLCGYDESVGYTGVSEVIAGAIPILFDFDFPIYDEAYRNVLCTKIIKHYYTREIGAETVAQWKFWLDVRLNEIMPYYNQLYKSTLLEFNPLYDVDIKTTRTGTTGGTTDVTGTVKNTDEKESIRTSNMTETGSGENTKNGGSDSTRRDLFSDTPQGALDNLENQTYLTNARKITDDDNYNETGNNSYESNKNDTETTKDSGERTEETTGKTVASSTEEYLETVQGKHGGVSSSKLLIEYRKTFLNIDMMIIDELADLFLTVW